MSDPGTTKQRLEALERDLTDLLLSAPDVSSGEWSSRHCGQWAQLWAVRLLAAQHAYDHATDNTRRDRLAYLRMADESTREWEKRKATAHEKERIDHMRKIVAHIEAQEAAASALGEIPE